MFIRDSFVPGPREAQEASQTAPNLQGGRFWSPLQNVILALVRPALLLPVGGLAVRLCLRPLLGAKGTKRLGDVIGKAFVDEQGRRIVPLPHPSGASLWLNRPENRALVDRALEHVRRYSEELCG